MAVKRRFGFPDTNAIQGSLSDTHRNYLVVFLSELAGTFLFLFFAFSIAQVANTPVPDNPNGPPNLLAVLFIALGFGCSVAVNVWLFYRVSGGMFNPAIALTLVLIGAIPASRGVVVFVAQMIGAIAAAAAVSATLPGPMAVNVRLGGDASVARGLFVEMFATLQLVFSVVMLAAVKHKATYLAPIGIGIATFIGHMCSIYYTGAGMNPARAFAPDVVAHSFPSYQWIYWLGPALGALVAAGYYRLLELLNWMTANPGQDYDDLETQMVEPWKQTLRPNVALQQPSGRPLLRSSTDKEVNVSSAS
ncbi:hypothetical protein B0A52_02307 [Exophiala mesophila]|uniref:Aquaporin-1 n=1 Tax=Exophiala mesophila TaxID=212818 RepID=A0A438NBY8_EXOME|nr:hypothetical protein B0A52_02307 [Exophiala mesophila]